MSVLLVLLGGACGAPARYLLDLAITSRHRAPFPWGTWAVNVLGSFLLGVVAALSLRGATEPWVSTLVGTGLCGAMTTFSTFSYETVRLIESDRIPTAVTYAAGSVAVGFAALSLGWWLGAL